MKPFYLAMLKKLILEEHSKSQKNLIIDFLGSNPEQLPLFMELFFAGDKVVKQRASYVVGSIEDIYPGVLKPYYQELVKNLLQDGLHNSIPRNTLRVLANKKLDEEHTGVLLDLCFGYLENHSLPVAVRAFAITAIYEHGNQYPELMNELKLLVENHLPHALPAYRYRAHDVLKKLSGS